MVLHESYRGFDLWMPGSLYAGGARIRAASVNWRKLHKPANYFWAVVAEVFNRI